MSQSFRQTSGSQIDLASSVKALEKAAGARRLFGIMFLRPPPLLEVSLEQAAVFIQFVNVVVRGPV